MCFRMESVISHGAKSIPNSAKFSHITFFIHSCLWILLTSLLHEPQVEYSVNTRRRCSFLWFVLCGHGIQSLPPTRKGNGNHQPPAPCTCPDRRFVGHIISQLTLVGT